ncbi:MAG: DUF3426 domain-containing protein [Proteobacteria bacterium]|nr:DUF3426 domain-containing protein [Pseudomonadota bacterium]
MMITRCPGCSTSFRVTPEQLKAVRGKVRCGQCQQVFNAIDTLLDMAAETNLVTAALPDLLEPAAFPGEPSFFAEPTENILVEPADASEPHIELDQPDAAIDWPAQQIEPLLHEENETPPRRRTWPWALAAVFALLLLLLQVIVHFRVELGVLLPDSKPFLQALCQPLDCDLPLPRKGDLISIESSDLRPDTNGQLMLAATLKNRAPFVQTYPHLELTLTDTDDRPVLRKVLAPADYLPKGLKVDAGFATNGEIAVNLALAHEHAANAAATGYRLYLFYP